MSTSWECSWRAKVRSIDTHEVHPRHEVLATSSENLLVHPSSQGIGQKEERTTENTESTEWGTRTSIAGPKLRPGQTKGTTESQRRRVSRANHFPFSLSVLSAFPVVPMRLVRNAGQELFQLCAMTLANLRVSSASLRLRGSSTWAKPQIGGTQCPPGRCRAWGFLQTRRAAKREAPCAATDALPERRAILSQGSD